MTRTHVILPVSHSTYDEVMHALQVVGYDHAFHKDNGRIVIDMHGIALARDTLTEQSKCQPS